MNSTTITNLSAKRAREVSRGNRSGEPSRRANVGRSAATDRRVSQYSEMPMSGRESAGPWNLTRMILEELLK